MPLVTTPAIVLAALRYGETSKIVRLATREHGIQSAIAKGALRPRSRFGAALQLLSEGSAQYVARQGRDLHTLTAFDLTRLPVGLAGSLERYTGAAALSEVMLRFAQPEPAPEVYEAFRGALARLEMEPMASLAAVVLREIWALVAALGFAPALDACARDGNPVPAEGPIAFSTRDGGVLCAACARDHAAARLPAPARAALDVLVLRDAPLPVLDAPNAAAHRRLLARFIRYHIAEGGELPALALWERGHGAPA